jgi:hypothetical protein
VFCRAADPRTETCPSPKPITFRQLIGSRIQISEDSDSCSGKVDLGFSAAGHKSKGHTGRFF